MTPTDMTSTDLVFPPERVWWQTFRWIKCLSSDGARWKIEGRLHDRSTWSPQSFELFKLLYAAGMTLREASPHNLEWVVPGCDDVFRGSYDCKGKVWTIESREWASSRWIRCDDRHAQIALGAKSRLGGELV
jgi:hypothetical protein